MDRLVPAEISLGTTHHLYPEYYLFGTEACAGWNPLDRGVQLGSWDRAEQYAHDIIEVWRSYLIHEGCACSVRSTVTDVRFDKLWAVPRKWITSPDAAVQVYKLHSAAHTPQKLPAGQQSKLELASCFFCLHSQRKLDSIHSIHFAWVHSTSRRLEIQEGFVYVKLSLWHLNKTLGSTTLMGSFKQHTSWQSYYSINHMLSYGCFLHDRT